MFDPMRPRPIIPSCTGQPSLEQRHSIASASSLKLEIAPDQRVGRTIMIERGFRRTLELRNDLLGESLAQLHTPLIEGIDLPDRSLGEDAMLVERDELAECGWRQGVQQQG